MTTRRSPLSPRPRWKMPATGSERSRERSEVHSSAIRGRRVLESLLRAWSAPADRPSGAEVGSEAALLQLQLRLTAAGRHGELRPAAQLCQADVREAVALRHGEHRLRPHLVIEAAALLVGHCEIGRAGQPRAPIPLLVLTRCLPRSPASPRAEAKPLKRWCRRRDSNT